MLFPQPEQAEAPWVWNDLIIKEFYDEQTTKSYLETLLTDWFVLKEQVRSPEFVIAVVTLHTLWVIVGVIVHHAVPHDLLLAHGARLLVGLVAVGAIGLLIFREEFSIKFLLASVTPEAFFVEDLAKCGAAILYQLSLAVITTL